MLYGSNTKKKIMDTKKRIMEHEKNGFAASVTVAGHVIFIKNLKYHEDQKITSKYSLQNNRFL
jgi:hypothetical protein